MIEFDSLQQNYQYIMGDITAMDYLLECESILGESGVYAYENWEEGEVIAGPEITEYWVDVSIMYPKSRPPDVKGLPRLEKFGIKYTLRNEAFNMTGVPTAEEFDDNPTAPIKSELYRVSVVDLKFPKRLIASNIADYLNLSTALSGVDYRDEKIDDTDDIFGDDDIDDDQEPTQDEGDDEV